MTKSAYVLRLFTKPYSNTLNYRLSQCVLSHKRFYCSKSDDSRDDSSPTRQDTGTSKLSKSPKASAKPQPLSTQEVKENAKKKLFNLLSELQVDPSSSTKSRSNLPLAKAAKRPLKSERFKDVLEKQNRTPQDEIEIAAKKVAESVPGDPKDTLAKLNEKLRILNLAKQPQGDVMVEENVKTHKEVGESLLEQESNKNIMSSVKDVAAEVTDGPIDKSSLSQRLLRLSVEGKTTETPRVSLDSLVKSMKMEVNKVQKQKEKFEQDQMPVPQRKQLGPRSFEKTKFNLFGEPPLELNIPADTKMAAKDSVWWRLEEKQMKLSVQFAPCNAFEEMIMWTEQGKHWKFPIDNETEMGAEENVGFHEHVFLEEHLHGFPTKGPVRHFMDLVVVGLSMNPYISVERKIENINWFRDYFKEKEEILQECGALG